MSGTWRLFRPARYPINPANAETLIKALIHRMRNELATDILQQYGISLVVLAHLVERDASPWHDGLVARDIGRCQCVTGFVPVGRAKKRRSWVGH
jgi:hypothetical protein